MTPESGEKPDLPFKEEYIIAHKILFVALTGDANDISGTLDQLCETHGEEKVTDAIDWIASKFEKTSGGPVHEATQLAMVLGKIDDII